MKIKWTRIAIDKDAMYLGFVTSICLQTAVNCRIRPNDGRKKQAYLLDWYNTRRAPGKSQMGVKDPHTCQKYAPYFPYTTLRVAD